MSADDRDDGLARFCLWLTLVPIGLSALGFGLAFTIAPGAINMAVGAGVGTAWPVLFWWWFRRDDRLIRELQRPHGERRDDHREAR